MDMKAKIPVANTTPPIPKYFTKSLGGQLSINKSLSAPEHHHKNFSDLLNLEFLI
jgi:hypothetical protein